MSSVSEIANIFEAFQQVNVLIIGDVMIDRYLYGSSNRISPEAPVPIFDIERSEDILGGAANVALNVKKLGGTPILVSVAGNDNDGQKLLKLLHQKEIYSTGITLAEGRKTTVKTRVINEEGKYLHRFDYEMTDDIDERFEIALIDSTVDLIDANKPSVILLQDYNKGVLTHRLIANFIHIGKQLDIPVVVDPKINNFFNYKDCTLFKPNLREASESLGLDLTNAQPDAIHQAAREIRERLNCKHVVLTLSEQGMLFDEEGDSDWMPAYERNIVDVSGAGDTVVSVLAMGVAMGLDLFATTELANIAGGLVCEKPGVCPIDAEELMVEAERIMFGEEEISDEIVEETPIVEEIPTSDVPPDPAPPIEEDLKKKSNSPYLIDKSKNKKTG